MSNTELVITMIAFLFSALLGSAIIIGRAEQRWGSKRIHKEMLALSESRGEFREDCKRVGREYRF